MTTESFEESYNGSTSMDYATSSALQIRLDVASLIENIEMFLKGEVVVLSYTQDGGIQSKRLAKGDPRANAQGIQSILSWIQSIINTQVVQGNFPSDRLGVSRMYENFVYYCRCDFAESLVINRQKWNIAQDDINFIVDSVMNIIEPFMTRLIDNKERESYGESIRYLESPSQEKNNGGGFNLFGKG